MKSSILILLSFTAIVVAAKLDKNLVNYIEKHPGQNVKVWIFFNDKGPRNELSFAKEYARISERARLRRSKMDDLNIIKFYDYPVYTQYKELIEQYVLKVYNTSRWLNAVSADVEISKLDEIKNLECVKEIRLVQIFKKPVPNQIPVSLNKINSVQIDTMDYGDSFGQLDQIGVIKLHEMGLSGKSVVIAMLDDGFNQYDTHITFDRLDVLDAYDFVHHDKDVADREANPREGWHGTAVLSVIAGFTQGTLIGVAYNASYILAKTEIDNKEIPQEEDNWVAALEWAEAKGADIVSSSLGYIDWYSWEDMDGKTATTTLATNISETLGMIVVNSAGNEGGKDQPNTLIAPGDGQFVITVGGVDIKDNYFSLSSYGPTVDGRIKPDVCALGINVLHASDSNTEGFFYGSGTSFSAPLVAGAIALLLEAFPHLKPNEVREAIKKTASQAETPDNFLGYGILNIAAAYEYVKHDSLPERKHFKTIGNSPNPFRVYTRIEYTVNVPSMISLTVYDVLGREVFNTTEKFVESNGYDIILGDQLGASGLYFYQIKGKEFYSGDPISKSGKLLFLR